MQKLEKCNHLIIMRFEKIDNLSIFKTFKNVKIIFVHQHCSSLTVTQMYLIYII